MGLVGLYLHLPNKVKPRGCHIPVPMDPSHGPWRMSHLGFQVEESDGVVKPGASRTLGAGANHLRFARDFWEGSFGHLLGGQQKRGVVTCKSSRKMSFGQVFIHP